MNTLDEHTVADVQELKPRVSGLTPTSSLLSTLPAQIPSKYLDLVAAEQRYIVARM
jgi:hypothetical protein